MIAPDTSVVIAALAPWHEAHAPARAALAKGEARLPAHVAYETTSALSRMPEGFRIAARVVLDAIERDFPQPWLTLDAARTRAALRKAVDAGVRGGALYDALIASTVAHHGGELVSADNRALSTYRTLNVPVVVLDV